MTGVFLGLRTVVFPAPDLAAAKAWWTEVLGAEPYFDQPFYVGFDVGGYELGLAPDEPVEDGPTTYWGVADLDAAAAALLSAGATVQTPIRDVGEGIRLAAFRDPVGNLVGIIHNPNFSPAPEA